MRQCYITKEPRKISSGSHMHAGLVIPSSQHVASKAPAARERGKRGHWGSSMPQPCSDTSQGCLHTTGQCWSWDPPTHHKGIWKVEGSRWGVCRARWEPTSRMGSLALENGALMEITFPGPAALPELHKTLDYLPSAQLLGLNVMTGKEPVEGTELRG